MAEVFIVLKTPQVTYLNSGGKIGDMLRAEVTCDKCEWKPRFIVKPRTVDIL